MSAIETTYRGVRFRSRLEARWAVFFDDANVEWHYEQQGYESGRFRYLPDFFLPSIATIGGVLGLHVEVKGSDEMLKSDLHRMRSVMEGNAETVGAGLLILGPIPKQEPAKVPTHSLMWVAGGRINNALTFWTSARQLNWQFLQGAGIPEPPPSCSSEMLHFMLGHRTFNPLMARSYEAAISARFEHGESGRPLNVDAIDRLTGRAALGGRARRMPA